MDQIYVEHQPAGAVKEPPNCPARWYLVLQGGGALGAYQGGVYQALHEASIDPDWVVGMSIGAINGAIIAGNEVDTRLERLREFWDRVERKPLWDGTPFGQLAGNAASM